MLSLAAFLRGHIGHFLTGSFTLLATCAILSDTIKGRDNVASDFDKKIDGVNTKIVKSDLTRLEAEVDTAVEICIVPHRTAGNNKPLQDYVRRVMRARHVRQLAARAAILLPGDVACFAGKSLYTQYIHSISRI
jgi:hypothetical protein